MHNPEQAIAQWREQMRSSGVKSRADLDELESHLRDEIKAQLAKKLEPEQAFQAAVQQIGAANTLNAEFKKVSRVKSALEYKIEKVMCVVVFGVFAVLAIALLVRNPFGMTPIERFLGVTAAVVGAALGLVSLWAWRVVPVIESIKMRWAVAIACGVVGAVITCVIFRVMENLPEPTVGQLTAMLFWGFVPLMAGGVIGGAFVEAGDRRVASA